MHACTYTHRIGGRGLKHYVQQMRSSSTQVELMITQSQRRINHPKFSIQYLLLGRFASPMNTSIQSSKVIGGLQLQLGQDKEKNWE